MEAKKSPKADLQRWTSTFFNVGLSISLGLVILAFNYAQPAPELQDLGDVSGMEELIDMPITEVKPPEPPKPKILDPVIIPVEPEEAPELELEVVFASDITDLNIDEFITEMPVEEAAPEAPFVVLEDGASFVGGELALYKYLAENTDYPSQARRMGITGRVFVKFVVEPDGSISNAQVLRGIGAGCDEAALEAIKNMPAWEPGRQRGRAVRQWIHIPVNFTLN